MAEQDPIVINEEEEEEEKRIQHYSSYHQILLVGEGDFSFSLCLAHSFGSASNIVASSLQSYDVVIKMYKNGKSNLEKLKSLGGIILHGVDATKMQHHCDLRTRKFDRIIYNFPHAGFYAREDNNHLIQMHKNLVGSFFGSAKRMLRVDGQIHVTHKTTPPYDLWDLVGLASKNSLICIECAEFKIENYPGYNNKRGAGSKCDEPFHLGECSTFKFILNPSRKNVPRTKKQKRHLHAPSQNFHKIANSISPPIYSFQRQISRIDSRNSPTYVNNMNGFPSYASLPATHDPRSDFFKIFKGYFSYIQETFGREDVGVEFSVRQAIHRGALMFSDETGRPREDYLKVLEELHFWSRSRILGLQQKLQDLDRRVFEQQGMGYYL
ncbi:heavy metal-associated isoprenylated plant protein 41-like [Lycium ferocissimum]|uniref:heavy metal-associated isoprenylated plant protein 41-like n=1 Tax=Lycium ferocissimum TaxID=112874 RepID=UPI002814FF23|nr:heavy metal-associated isoprenylated plant protein 41-like [Lycium ferocissimum]